MELDFFNHPGASVLVDGQFGSTGKGLLACWLAEKFASRFTHVTTNAGPNSGHTAYFRGEKVMTQQLPVAGVVAHQMGYKPLLLLNGGAICDPKQISAECSAYRVPHSSVAVHPCAARIDEAAAKADAAVVQSISGTGKGTGPAQARKISRINTSGAVMRGVFGPPWATARGSKRASNDRSWDSPWDWSEDVVFVETAQGFSLGVNSERFYPHTTSRECSVGQALADARIPAQVLDKVFMCLRTYPIRVGSVEGSTSGGMYPDQTELSWAELNLEPELTTVTKRVRRIFSWSRIQFREAVAANWPDVIFLNFCNYLSVENNEKLIKMIHDDYFRVTGKELECLLLGFGPKNEDIVQWKPKRK